MINYYEIAKKCINNDIKCGECELQCATGCHSKLVIELVKIIDEYRKYDSFLAAHGCFGEMTFSEISPEDWRHQNGR